MIASPFLDQALQRETARVGEIFQSAQARFIEAPTLLAADVMLDLYGEDIRERAYIVHDPIEGDLVLRPDFTVPIAQMHMAGSEDRARYAYLGRVWRRRRETNRAEKSFWQMGIEIYDPDQGKADAEALAVAMKISEGSALDLRAGDLGLIIALLDRLEIADFRREALKRHIWRPRAFAKLLERFSEYTPIPHEIEVPIPEPVLGLRSEEMIASRIERLKLNAALPPLEPRICKLIETVFSLKGSLSEVGTFIEEMAASEPLMEDLAIGFGARNSALADMGIAPDKIAFDAGFGRESMEYYDGFVFGFYGRSRAPIIVGGRYDHLTATLGGGRTNPAIGLAYRPELAIREKEGQL